MRFDGDRWDEQIEKLADKNYELLKADSEHTEHTETNPPPVMSSFRVFGVFRGSLLFGDKSEYVVAAPQYRATANTSMGWKNSNWPFLWLALGISTPHDPTS